MLSASFTSICTRLTAGLPLTIWVTIGTGRKRRGLGTRSAPSMVSVVAMPGCSAGGVIRTICGGAADTGRRAVQRTIRVPVLSRRLGMAEVLGKEGERWPNRHLTQRRRDVEARGEERVSET